MLNPTQQVKSIADVFDEANEVISAEDLANITITSIDKRLVALRNYLENGDGGEAIIKAQIKELKLVRGFILQVMRKKEAAVRAFLYLSMKKEDETNG